MLSRCNINDNVQQVQHLVHHKALPVESQVLEELVYVDVETLYRPWEKENKINPLT